jgi:hypothetical protein
MKNREMGYGRVSDLRQCRRQAWLFALLLCSTVWAADPKQDIASWMSKENQARSPKERVAAMQDIAKASGRLDGEFMQEIVAKDPALEVRLAAIEQCLKQTGVKKIRYIVNLLPPPLREDRELVFGVAETIYRVKGKDVAYKAFVLSSLIKWGGYIPYPDKIPTSGTVKVEWISPRTRKPATLEMDAAQAKRAREMHDRIVEMFNSVAESNVKPGPDAMKEMQKWNALNGGKTIEADLWLAKGTTNLKAPDQAKLVRSSLLGTAGTEWFCGGGFQPDGTIVLAGVSLGPTLDFPGVSPVVLGVDQPAPPVPQGEVQGTHELTGEKIYRPYRWSHPQATPFVVRLSPDAKKIISVSRLPWCSGGVTDATVDDKGNIYLAGPARTGIRKAGGEIQSLPPCKKLEAEPRKAPARGAPAAPDPDLYEEVYVAKLSPAADKVLWVRLADNPNGSTYSPDININSSGQVVLTGPDQRVLTPDGKQTSQRHPRSLKRLPSPKCAFDPDTGMMAFASEHHSPTGHEPWRCGYATIYKPDGATLSLYNWPGPFVGGTAGLVADSPLYGARFDLNGDLILLGWSDGGNSMFYCEPLDLRRGARMRGLGLNGSGVAGATHFGYIVRVSTKTWRTIGGTMLAAQNPVYGPSGMSADDVFEAADRSLMMVGDSAWGAPQSPHNLCTSHPSGPYIAVMNKDCTSLRFGASMQACAAAQVRSGSAWGMITGKQNGRPMAMFVTAATATGKAYGRVTAAPAHEPMQEAFAGGDLDGYFTLLDLEYHPPANTAKTEEKK